MNTVDIEEENRCLQLSTENKVAYLPLHMCGSYCTFMPSFFEVYTLFLGNIGSIETTSQATLVYTL
jgi:hypothetical protein